MLLIKDDAIINADGDRAKALIAQGYSEYTETESKKPKKETKSKK